MAPDRTAALRVPAAGGFVAGRRTRRGGRGAPAPFLDARARRAAVVRMAAIDRCQAAFDATPGLLAVRGGGAGVDRLTRAARERDVDAAIAALNEAEASRRMLGVGQAGVGAGDRSPDAERAAKAAMLVEFHSRWTARTQARVGTPAAPVMTLRVHPDALTGAGRAALAVMLREAAVEAATGA